MRPMNRKRRAAAAVAGFTIISCCRGGVHNSCTAFHTPQQQHTPMGFLSTTYNNSSSSRRIRNSLPLFARKGSGTARSSPSKNNTKNNRSSSSTIIEQVKPITSVSQAKRLSAIEALTRQQRRERNSDNIGDASSTLSSPLLADMDAAAMLLETFTKSAAAAQNDESSSSSSIISNNSSNNKKQTASKNKSKSNGGGVPGATSQSTIRAQSAYENGYALSPRDSRDLYREDGSNQARWAVDSLIEKLDERIRENESGGIADDYDDEDDDDIDVVPTQLKKLQKRGRGRPRKNPLPEDIDNIEGRVSEEDTDRVAKLEPIQNKRKVTGGSLMKNKDPSSNAADNAKNGKIKSSSKKALGVSINKGSDASSSETKNKQLQEYPELPLVGASAIVNKQRQRHNKRLKYKSLPKSRRDSNGNIISSQDNNDNDSINNLKNNKKGDGRIDSKRYPTISNDSTNLNRYYRTELLTAKEEYTLGMRVKFMIKCEAVHEGLSLQLDRMPSIAEWAYACGFTDYDNEMYSESYIDNELDKQIRPSGSEVDELDPNMFVGNGLVNDSGVGRGKGRAKKPPPTKLIDFYDDSYEKFKKKKKDEINDTNMDTNNVEEEEEEDGDDIFLYRQKMAPGQPINRGSPRIFREMMLTAKEAKQRMVQCNMRLVVSIARRYHGVGVNVQDLVQEGSLGLARAAEKFDPKKGFKFSTYASWWIQQAVFRSIAYHSRTIRLPVHVHNLLNKVRRARAVMQHELGRMPTNEEMAEEMDMSIEKYNKMIRNTRNALSLERPMYKNNPKDLGHESEALVGDMVDSTAVIFDEKTPEQNVDQGLLHNDIQYMLGVSAPVCMQ